ncbi:hypothetical protein OBBRIDRAFT_793217 [Obba rivulosa]|uniref:TEA domain-containing protein n=1 Tax=Obba rivulosa TaxID=1052685 RepID=A0A8E2AYJ2_9APHY|nr:hypothetical protein OBBRIDRAFT_793217 [Obba rivulosa]
MSSARHFSPHVWGVPSTDGISYAVPPTSDTSCIIQTILSSRKRWKKGKGEVIWPPNLEAALMEGLTMYHHIESHMTRTSKRFPMRNKLISEHIYKATGKLRTPKQVGSRLAQLRDTKEGQCILELLSNCHSVLIPSHNSPKYYRSSTNTAAVPSANLATGSLTCNSDDMIEVPSNVVDAPPSASPSLTAAPAPLSVHMVSSPLPAYQSPGPRPLRAIDPTVTFLAQSPLAAYTRFRVLHAGQTVHQECAEFTLCASSCPEVEHTFLYRTRLVPGYWHVLCESYDPMSYIIVQEIVRTMLPSHTFLPDISTSFIPLNTEEVILSVVYQLTNGFTAQQLFPTSSVSAQGNSGDSSGSDFAESCSLGFSSDFGNLMIHPSVVFTNSIVQLQLSHSTPVLLNAGDYENILQNPLDLMPDVIEWNQASALAVSSAGPNPVQPLSLGQGDSQPDAGVGGRDFCDYLAQHYDFGVAFSAPN